MLNKTIEKNGKKLRYGYTTGSCATAGTKAALEMYLSQEKKESIIIDTPRGWPLDLIIHDASFNEEEASCSIIKDAGDDPDITNGIKIFSKIKPWDQEGILFIGGEGVGTVTSVGLSILPGEPAINPVPREMMTREIQKTITQYAAEGGENLPKGWVVEISMPQGEALAKRTFNPKLGIVGGLSVVGTSGIVEPMSEDALKATMKLELNVLKEKGYEEIIFVPGNYGKDFSKTLELDQKLLIKTSNFIGFMLDEAERLGFKKILLIGHLGKLVKVAGGIFNTHSRMADGRMEILTAYYGIYGGSKATMLKIMESKTTDEAVDFIKAEDNPNYFNNLAEVIKKKAMGRVFESIEIEVIIFSKIHGFLGQSQGAKEMRQEICIH